MTEQFIPKSFRLPSDLLEALTAEATEGLRNDTTQLIYILRERYKKKKRLDDKQKTGSLRK